MYLGLPAPLFTIDFEGARGIDLAAFKRFFDCLEPAFGLQVSLGQTNTVVLCPALTSHSELSPDALRAAGISPTTIRIAVGDEDPRTLLAHFIRAARRVRPVSPASPPSNLRRDRHAVAHHLHQCTPPRRRPSRCRSC
jgi:cystathionine beta-lyase/cystathionine gamma-synthase